MARLLTSKELVEKTRDEIRSQVERQRRDGREVCLVVIIATDNEAALSYARVKERTALELGIRFKTEVVDASVNQEGLNQLVRSFSDDPLVHGILLELPLRHGLNPNMAMRFLDPKKDVDGLGDFNVARIAIGDEQAAILPATPQACIALAESQIDLAGRLVAVVGRGRSVGRPLAHMLTNRGATVIHCHSGTPDLPALTRQCDVVFTATGRAGLIGGNHVHADQILIDAGTDYSTGKVRGDVDAEAVGPIVEAYTPVPGGVGPLTSLLLFGNLLRAITLQNRGET